jgi:hypothetical protein
VLERSTEVLLPGDESNGKLAMLEYPSVEDNISNAEELSSNMEDTPADKLSTEMELQMAIKSEDDDFGMIIDDSVYADEEDPIVSGSLREVPIAMIDEEDEIAESCKS